MGVRQEEEAAASGGRAREREEDNLSEGVRDSGLGRALFPTLLACLLHVK